MLCCSNTQKRAILQSLDFQQKLVLKEIAINILRQIIPINKKTLKKLTPHKLFLRKLCTSKTSEISKVTFARNFKVICEIIQIAFNYHGKCKKDRHIETYQETGISSMGSVGSNDQEESSRYDESSSSEETSDNESNCESAGETSDSISVSSRSSSQCSVEENESSPNPQSGSNTDENENEFSGGSSSDSCTNQNEISSSEKKV